MAERTLPVGANRLLIRDEGVKVEYVDLIAEAAQGNGVICLSFAASATDADNEAIAIVSSRLRMHLGTAQFLHKLLGDMITNALKPPEQGKAN